jgi:hypothetical protein
MLVVPLMSVRWTSLKTARPHCLSAGALIGVWNDRYFASPLGALIHAIVAPLAAFTGDLATAHAIAPAFEDYPIT